jgi:serine phosphatase RsbU (regulator of sigma subunit)/K+-sensing histidine kinase KdpD/anti-sigma regulatory factor (Ser/Thr protein kinase)
VTSGTRSGSRANGVAGHVQRTRGTLVRYGTAAVLACASVALVVALLPFASPATYTPLLGAVAISVWFGGLGPGLLAIGIGWTSALFLLPEPRYTFALSEGDDAARWTVSLMVALVITWVAWLLHRGGIRAASAAGEAERDRARLEQLQATASALSAAATPEEVAGTLVSCSVEALAADGAAVGMIDGESLSVREAVGISRRAEADTVPLAARTVLATAARESRICWTNDAEELERSYPDSARRLPGVGTLLAVPLTVGGRTVGALGVVYEKPAAATNDARTRARLLAELGSQALQRAMLFAEERDSRTRLEQILAIAPRVQAGTTPEEVTGDVCRSALETFDVDAAHVWTVREGGFEVVNREPPLAELPAGTVLPASTFRVLPRAVAELRPAFVRDVQATLTGLALKAAQAAGTQTTLRVPIVVAGTADRLLVLEWRRDLPEPTPGFVALVRRFADQAGLAIEHAERRRAEEVAVKRADDTRRLLGLTAALAAATTLDDVSAVILDQCERGFGAAAGVVGRVLEHTGEFELVRAEGFEDELVERWRRFPIRSDLPLGDAIGANEIVVVASREERDRRYPALAGELVSADRGSWMAVPLPFGGHAIGGIGLSFAAERRFTDADLDLMQALARQAGQAFERARLLEAEQLARTRAERIAARLAQLHALATTLSGALSPLEVATAAATQVAAVLDTSSVGVYMTDSSGALELLGGVGDFASERASASGDAVAHPALHDAVRNGAPIWLDGSESASDVRHRDVDAPLGVVPLFTEGRPLGVLVARTAPGRTVDDEQRRFVETVGRQVATPLDRARLLESERAARRRVERLQALTAALSGSLTEDEVARVFLEQAAGALEADASSIAMPDERGNRLEVMRWRGFEAGDDDSAITSTIPLDAPHPIADSFRRRRAISFATRAELEAAYPDLAGRSRYGLESVVVSPLVAADRILGVSVFAWRAPRRLSAEDVALVSTLASQCAQALDRARRYESERTIAETLQRSVLPELLPTVEGLELAARYLPGTSGLDVGGDWFDVIELESGRVGLVVGDVVGKGVQAAATMSQLRNALRAFAFERLKPSAAVTRLNRLLDTLPEAPFATLAFVTLDPRTGVCRYALAGHPPPLLRYPDGRISYLEGGRSLPLGIGGDVSYRQAALEVPPGSVLLLYTDGLIERRDRSLDEGLELLGELVAGGPALPDALVDHILAHAFREDERGDDVAVLAVRFEGVPAPELRLTLPAAPEALQTAREQLRAWLAHGGVGGDDAHDIVLATWEACANAVEHPEQPTASEFELEASRQGDSVRVTVRDAGRWRAPSEREERGLGLLLMRNLMQSVEVTPAPTGTVVYMERRLTAPRNGHATVDGDGSGAAE